MRDIHAHILPGVDDGARDLEESLEMIEAARVAGVTSIVCTPHVRDPWFDYDHMWDAFEALAAATDFPLQMGWEVNYRKFRELGFEWADYLHFDGSDEFLLELPFECVPGEGADIERFVTRLQAMGYRVIVAHPERCSLVRDDLDYARRLVGLGCELQASIDFVEGGRTGNARKTANRLIKNDLYAHVASDAHRPRHYELLGRYATQGERHV